MPGSLSEFERLFLLEFFVDFVNLKSSSFDNADSSLCVSFQFLHYPVMRVCEEDFTPKTKPLTADSKVIFKSGKSCLFSVHSDENKKIPSQFDLVIAVCQKTRCGEGRQLVGQATVSLGNSFINLLRPPTDLTTPTTGVRHDLFPLKDKGGKVIGSIAAFARISCFGKLIVTQFQLAAEDEVNYMFKGTDAEKLFKEDGLSVLPNIDYSETVDGEIPKDTPYQEIFGYPKESEDECESEIREEERLEEEDESTQSKTQVEDKANQGAGEQGAVVCQETSQEEENYKEIGAEVNGHSIIIRVLKKRKRQRKSEESAQQMPACCCPPEPPVCPNAPKLNVCECDYPLPPELIPRCPTQCQCCCSPSVCTSPPPPPRNPHNGTQKSNSIQVSKKSFQKQNVSVSECPREDCPLNLAAAASSQQEEPGGTVAMKGDQVYFHSSNKPGEPIDEKEKKLADSVYYKSDCNDPNKKRVSDSKRVGKT